MYFLKYFIYLFIYLFINLFIYLFLERGERRKKERERNISVWLPLTCPPPGTWPTTQAWALIGNRTGDPLVRRLVLSPLSHTSQGTAHILSPTCCGPGPILSTLNVLIDSILPSLKITIYFSYKRKETEAQKD